jgi:lysophospholipase L1-like esterase
MIRFSGRIDRRNPLEPAFAYPGVRIHLRFTGTSVAVRLRDHGQGTNTTTNSYDVSIDGGPFTTLMAKPGEHLYPLALHLPEGEHTALLVKRSEGGPGGSPGSGKASLLGVELDKNSQLLRIEAPSRRLEFIGDSITCGYGNEISTAHPENSPFTTAGSNARLAYGSLIADALGSDVLIVAASGRGVYRNWEDYVGPTIPALYFRSLPDDPTSTAQLEDEAPNAILINLGTNDFSPGKVSRDEFRAAYGSFLDTLRKDRPLTHIVLLAGPQLTDGYPAGTQRWTDYREDLKTIVQTRTSAGDKFLFYFELEQQQAPFGQDWHPSRKTHEHIQEQVLPFLKQLLDWEN